MPAIYLAVLAVSSTCIGTILAVFCVSLFHLVKMYADRGPELFATYAVAFIVPATLIGVLFASAIALCIWSARRLFKCAIISDYM